jgi:hypothetical protein
MLFGYCGEGASTMWRGMHDVEPAIVAMERRRWNQHNQHLAWQSMYNEFNDDQREIFNLVRYEITSASGEWRPSPFPCCVCGWVRRHRQDVSPYLYNALLAFARSRVLATDAEE